MIEIELQETFSILVIELLLFDFISHWSVDFSVRMSECLLVAWLFRVQKSILFTRIKYDW